MKRWFDTIQAAPAVVKGYAVMDETRKKRKPMDDKTRAIYFGQTAGDGSARTGERRAQRRSRHKRSAGSSRRRAPSCRRSTSPRPTSATPMRSAVRTLGIHVLGGGLRIAARIQNVVFAATLAWVAANRARHGQDTSPISALSR
jgi:hypothetical protein